MGLEGTLHDTMKKPRHKAEIVLRIFRGETPDALSRGVGVIPGKFAQWRDEALAGMQAELQPRRTPVTPASWRKGQACW